VRAEEVALPLDQRRGQPLGPEPVVVGQRRREARRRDALLGRERHDPAPPLLGATHGVQEVVVDQQRGQLRRLVVRRPDVLQELGADDAAGPPDLRHRTGVDVPVVLLARGLDLLEALRVRHDLGGEQRLLDVGLQIVAAGARSRGRAGQAARGLAGGGVAGQRAGEHGLGDAADRHAQVQRGLHGPASGALLLGLIQHDVDERLAGLRVVLPQHLGGDLDQVRPKSALVPAGEDVRDLGR
jgi:hypothetical protein